MKSPFVLFGKLNPAGIKKYLTDENVIFAGALFLAGFFVILIVINGYLFYAVRAREAVALPPPALAVALMPQDIDAAIKLIDRRAQEYQALLNIK